MTKQVHDESLRYSIVEPANVEVVPQALDNRLTIATPAVARKPKSKVKVRMVKTKVTARKSNLEKATARLYDLEDNNAPEKLLHVDFDLYQMEQY